MRYVILLILSVFALNLKVNGQCQAGEIQTIIEIDGSIGQYNSEIYWRLYNDDTDALVAETTAGFLDVEATERDTLCLQDGVNYRFETYDTFGDGWNDAEFNIFYNDGFVILNGMPNNGEESSGGSELEEIYVFRGGDRPGDDCSLPKEISVGETVNVSTESYTSNYQLDPLFDSGNEAIFAFTPLISEQYAITFSEIPSLNRGSLQLFDNCYDNTPTRIAFDSTGVDNNLMEVYENLTAGNTYYIVISNNSADTGIDFIEGNLSVSYSGTPINNSCENAISLTVDGDSIYSRTTNVLPSEIPVFSMHTQDGDLNEAYGDSLLFDFTLATQEDILIEIGDVDLYNPVFIELEKRETCGDAAEATYRRAAFEDIEKVFAFNNLLSGTYRLKVFLPSSYEDEFYVSVKTQGSQVVAPNQTCENATELNIYSGSESLSSSSITSIPYFNASDSGIGAPCTQDSIYNAGTGDVWVKAQVPYSRNLIIETFGEYYDELASPDQAMETRISVYTGTCGSISEFYCSDKVEAHQKDTISGLPQGEEVFIRLWDKNGDNGGLMNVRLIEPEPLPIPETQTSLFPDSLHVNFTNFSGDVEFFYEILISEDSFQTYLPGFDPATISSYQGQIGVPNLQPATTYYFQIFSKSNKLTNSDTTIFQVETSPYTINSIANGDWSNPNIWEGGIVPPADSAVNIYHRVAINQGESFDIKDVLIDGSISEQLNVGLWINNGTLKVDKSVRVQHFPGIITDSVGVFMFSDTGNSSTLDVGTNLMFELFDAATAEPIHFFAINNGDSLNINVGNEFSFKHTGSDSTQIYDKPNIDFQSVDLTVGGNLNFFNNHSNSLQPFNVIFNNSRITANEFEINAVENTNEKFVMNFTGNTELNLSSNFVRNGNGGKINFTDQSVLRFEGVDYQEITGFGEFQDSIIYNNIVVDVAKDLNNGREIPVLKTAISYEEIQTKILIQGELNLLNGIITDESDVFSIDRNEIIFGASATVIGANPNSYVTEPVSKIGNTPFTFPVGSDLGLRQIRISNNDEFQISDKVSVLSYDNSCGISDSLLTNSSLARDRTQEFWQLSAELSTNNVAASFEPIIQDPQKESITDFSALELVVFNNGNSLGNSGSSDSSFITATELNFSLADTIRLGLSSNLEFENPFYEGKRILNLSTYSAAPGESVTINYSASFASPSDQVFFGGKQATVISSTNNSITVSVPEGARSGKVELIYENDRIAYSHQDFTIKYNATNNALLGGNYANISILDSISGNILLGQTNMQLGQINNDDIFDAMIVSQDYQSITVVNNLSGIVAKEEFNLFNEGTLINPTNFELGLSNLNGTLAVDAIFEFEVNGDNGLLYYENDGIGNFSQFGEGEADSETIFNDYLFNELNFNGESDALFSVFDVSSATSLLSVSSEGNSYCNPYSLSNLPFSEPNNKDISSIILGDYINNGSLDLGFLVKEESMIGILDLYSQDTSFYYSNNSRTADQIFEIKSASLLNDGSSQIVASNQSTNEIEVYSFNTGTSSIDITTVPLNFSPAKMDAEDINGDGFQDLIVSDQDSSALHVLLNDGTGVLSEEFSVYYSGGIIVDFDVLDLNNDGIKDFLLLQEGGQLSAAYYEELNVNPPSISASNITTSSFDLAWDSVENAVEYEVFISLENDTISDLSTDSTFILGDTVLSFEAPFPFETYYVYGRAISQAGDTSNFSNPLTVNLQTLDSLSFQTQNITTSSFDLVWDSVENAVEYEVFISLENDTIADLSSDSTFILGDTSLLFEAPIPFETYYVYGRSISSAGDTSNYSTPVTVNLATLDSLSIQAENVTTSSFDLVWGSIENAVEYEVFISLENDTIADLSTDSTFILGDTALSFEAPFPFETYYVYGRSISSAGDTSNYSNPLEVNLSSLDSLEFQAQNITNNSFDLSWNTISNAANYEIVISLENSPNAGLDTDSTFLISDTILTFNAPVDFDEYFVFGRAISAQGDTAEFGNSYAVQLESIQVPEPIANTINSNSFNLSWAPVAGADQYEVYIGTSADFTSLGINDSVFVIANENINYQAPEYSELYYFYVKAISSFGDTSAFSIEDSIKLPVSPYLVQDSLAMVALYQTNGGENWTNNQNWLTGKLNTWEGLEMNADSLFAINLPSNQLEGILPNELENLNFIADINFSNNNLTDVSAIVAQSSNLTTLNLSGNTLSFEQLEGLSPVPNFIYSDQDFNYSLPNEIFESLGTDISIVVETSATENTFQWYKDSVQINGETSSTLNLINAQRSDEGLYYVEINNAIFPELTLSSNITEVKISSLERDVAALRQFYESTNGANWSTIVWNTTSDNPTEWSSNNQDIIVEDNRVVEINLPENNLTGSIPEALNEVLGLRSIDLANNAIQDAVDLSSLPNLTQLDLSGNALGFDDLERNVSVVGFQFSDQANFGDIPNQKIPQGSDFTLNYEVQGSANVYEWYRNDELVNYPDTSEFLIDSITFETMGEYRLEVRNEIVNAVDPDFKLISNPVNIIASSTISGNVQDANEFATESGKVYLFSESNDGSFDSVRLENENFFQNIQGDGSFELLNIELGDYLIYVNNDENNYPDLLNTYFENTIDWELAEIVSLRTDINDIVITMEGEPQELTGTSSLSGYLEEEYEEGERKLPRRRVSGAGVSVRQLSASTREISFLSILANNELVAYLETDDNGEFEIPNLPAGSYTIKFDIPGVPMNEQSDINFDLTGEDQEALEIAAVSDNGQISVTKVSYTANKAKLTKNITVYPNPSNGRFNIAGTESISKIKIISTEGKLIEEISDFDSASQEIEIDLSNYPDGMYFIQIDWKDGLRSMNKLIKE